MERFNEEYVPFVVITVRSFPHSRIITGFVIRVTRQAPRVEHLGSFPGFSGVRVARSLVFCLVFCRSLLVLLKSTSPHNCRKSNSPFL